MDLIHSVSQSLVLTLIYESARWPCKKGHEPRPQEMHFYQDINVSYLTPDSDLGLTPDPDQFGALPPVRYINL